MWSPVLIDGTPMLLFSVYIVLEVKLQKRPGGLQNTKLTLIYMHENQNYYSII